MVLNGETMSLIRKGTSRFTYVNKHKLVTPKGGVGHKPFRKHRYDRWVNKSFWATINKVGRRTGNGS